MTINPPPESEPINPNAKTELTEAEKAEAKRISDLAQKIVDAYIVKLVAENGLEGQTQVEDLLRLLAPAQFEQTNYHYFNQVIAQSGKEAGVGQDVITTAEADNPNQMTSEVGKMLIKKIKELSRIRAATGKTGNKTESDSAQNTPGPESDSTDSSITWES